MLPSELVSALVRTGNVAIPLLTVSMRISGPGMLSLVNAGVVLRLPLLVEVLRVVLTLLTLIALALARTMECVVELVVKLRRCPGITVP